VALPTQWVEDRGAHPAAGIACHPLEQWLDLKCAAAGLAVLAAERVERRTAHTRLGIVEGHAAGPPASLARSRHRRGADSSCAALSTRGSSALRRAQAPAAQAAGLSASLQRSSGRRISQLRTNAFRSTLTERRHQGGPGGRVVLPGRRHASADQALEILVDRHLRNPPRRPSAIPGSAVAADLSAHGTQEYAPLRTHPRPGRLGEVISASSRAVASSIPAGAMGRTSRPLRRLSGPSTPSRRRLLGGRLVKHRLSYHTGVWPDDSPAYILLYG